MRSLSVTRIHPLTRLRIVAELFKLRLATLVVVSAAFGFLTGAETVSFAQLLVLCVGGTLLTGGSNGLNQVWEREADQLMARTAGRPIPTARLSVTESIIWSGAAAILGIFLLWYFLNTASGVLGLLAFFIYVFLYTPLKKVTNLAVFVGAIPGAIPPMLGYVAATNDYGIEAGSLFAMQFMWQFPHFWAIAWVLHDDYRKAGYSLLPLHEGKTSRSAFIILIYTLFLIPVSLMPAFFPIGAPVCGSAAQVIALVSGLVMAWYAFRLWRDLQPVSAKRLMFASFFYLPAVQLAYWLDRI